MLSGGGSGGAAPAEAAPVVEAPKEKEAFDIKIGAVDAKAKIKIIKEVRAMTGLGLKEVSSIYVITIALSPHLLSNYFFRQKI